MSKANKYRTESFLQMQEGGSYNRITVAMMGDNIMTSDGYISACPTDKTVELVGWGAKHNQGVVYDNGIVRPCK